MNIGLLGGTFNPIHKGHLIIAEYVRSQFKLERIYFIPSAIPPHKSKPPVEAHHRLSMIKLAIQSNSHFYCSSLEIERGGKSYSIDTVRSFKEKFGGRENLFFLIGLDAFREISTWKNYTQLFNLCKFIVINRPSYNPLDQSEHNLSMILSEKDKDLKLQIINSNPNEAPHQVCPQDNIDLFFVSIPPIGISSTKIRKMVASNLSIRYQVTDQVDRYIRKNNLYRN
ncbi:MAG: nicotinate-nucleotide adenylyltransferase [bacterium]